MKTRVFNLLTTAFIILFLSCNGNEETTRQITPDSANKSSDDSIIDATKDTVINITFRNNDTSVVVLGELKTTGQHIIVNVPVQKDVKLFATVIPMDSLMNIRFDRIIYPDGKSNGPLGKEISALFEKEGTVKLIIAHNLMAEGGLTKKFKLRVSVQRLV